MPGPYTPVPTGIFTILELPVDGSAGQYFQWSASRKQPSLAVTVPNAVYGQGGARACPVKPFPLGGKQRTVRTDYPGAQQPSEQVLGPSHKPTKLSGKWDDRFNFNGYAVGEMRRFEAMCKRGNPVRVSYLSVTREGLIIDWDFNYMRDWHIEYSFEMSVHNDPSQPFALDRSPDTTLDPGSASDATDTAVQATLQAHNGIPSSNLLGDLADDMADSLDQLSQDNDSLGATFDNSITIPAENPIDAYTRLATQFRQVRASAYDALTTLAVVRSDTDLSVLTAMSVLNFEDWSRSVRFYARLTMRQAQQGDAAATARANPDAKNLYRPYAGESLYAISRKFYGTPFSWGLIYQRNALSSIVLSGTELLVIPERGGGSSS